MSQIQKVPQRGSSLGSLILYVQELAGIEPLLTANEGPKSGAMNVLSQSYKMGSKIWQVIFSSFQVSDCQSVRAAGNWTGDLRVSDQVVCPTSHCK